MPISRYASSLLLNRLRSSRNLQEFGTCRRFQTRNYSDVPKHNRNRMANHHLFPEQPLDDKSSSWFKYMVPAGFFMIAGIGFLFHYNDERRAVLKGQGNEQARKTIYGPKFGGPFSLFDTEHRLVTDRDLLGNWILLYFGYTSSPDIGPEEVQKIAKALDILDSKKNVSLVPIFITIDPQRDSPWQLGAYLKEFDPRIVGLTGSIASIRQVAQEYRVYFKKVEEEGNDYLVDSSHKMYLLDPNLDIVRCFGTEYDAQKLSEEILMEISKSPK